MQNENANGNKGVEEHFEEIGLQKHGEVEPKHNLYIRNINI